VKTGAPQNALSFDVEDYFQVAALAAAVDRKSWDAQPARVDANTARLLALLARRGVRATFFVLGWIAERHPHIVRDIAAAGHEIACHGYSHELIYRQTPEVFREETKRALGILEDQAQTRIRGYRAATWSITRQSLWALDILNEQGFEYDSSIFPTHHDLYGIPEAPRVPHRLALPGGGTLLEFPPSTVRLGPWNLPVAGGGYFRLLPLAVTRWAIRHVNREGLPFLFYLHPWEIDPGQPRLKVGLKSRFRHYTNIAGCERKLDDLLSEFPMGPVWDALQAPAIPAAEPLNYLRAATAHGAGTPS
jgi:polysaccharide deacetylase family protein (PEP-CTERM system associated)